MIGNNAEKIEPLLAQMEQWSILSNMLHYIQYDKHPKNFHNLGISAVNVYKNDSDTKKEKGIIEIDFGPTLDVLKEEYLDVHKGIQSEIVSTTRRRIFSHIRARVYVQKIARQNRMSITIRHRYKQIIHVKIILHALQITPFFAKICFQDTKNSSRE